MFRREFFKAVVECLSGLVAATLAIPGLRFLFHPLAASRRKPGFVRVASLRELRADLPTRALVRMDRWDAFVHHPPGPVGSVWLVPVTSERRAENTESTADAAERSDPPIETVRCYQTVCPHLGCGINYESARGSFACPCHASDFDLQGRVLSGPSPRAMDELACRVTPPDADGRQWIEVEYREFRTGVPQKEPIT